MILRSAATATTVWFDVANDQSLFEKFPTATKMHVLPERERGENGPSTSMDTQSHTEVYVRLCYVP